LNRWDNRIGESPMKTALLILAVVVWLLLTSARAINDPPLLSKNDPGGW